MKQVLITGKNSYVGNSLEKWLLKNPDKYEVTKISVRDENWQKHDFSKYDVVFQVAGIAHSDTGNASQKIKQMYYDVNTDLTISIAKKAKASGIKQLIFMSSMIVYGDSAPIGQRKMITKETVPHPANFYGDSKIQAEIGIKVLNDADFSVAIIRPPMIYGKGSKGNYPILSKVAQKFPIFPDIDNERSMLHIDNLCEFTRLIIENQDSGTFFPQNSKYVKTSEMVKVIAKAHGKHIVLTKTLNPFIKMMSQKIGIANKVFGNLSYDMSMSDYKEDYRVVNFDKSIHLTEI